MQRYRGMLWSRLENDAQPAVEMEPHSCRVICVDTQVVVEMPTEEQVDLAVDTLKLLADGTRLRILWVLLHGEHSVSRLADHIGAPPASVSQHLAKLRLARLV